jgi:hypothetical protein
MLWRPRHQRGTSWGGRFAKKQHGDADEITLVDPGPLLVDSRSVDSEEILVHAHLDLLDEGHTQAELEDHPELLRARFAQQMLVARMPGATRLDPPGSHSDKYRIGPDGRPSRVLYVSYGSNVSTERFMHYIEGGKPRGSRVDYEGCRNPTPPDDVVPVIMHGTVHFAGRSAVWGGGVAFLDHLRRGKSLGKAYLVTSEQFDDIVAQECGHPIGVRPADINAAISKGVHDGAGRYGRLVHVGDLDGSPAFTFTGHFSTAQARRGNMAVTPWGRVEELPRFKRRSWEGDSWPVFTNRPSDAYTSRIGEGLAETYDMDGDEIDTYFGGAAGVR